jgi:hypothetical protein
LNEHDGALVQGEYIKVCGEQEPERLSYPH